MNATDLVRTATGNSLRSRSRSRTVLTVLAIFIGAFTLTLTNGVGTGANRYITDTVAVRGASDTLTVTHTPADGDGPRKYSPTGPMLESDGGASDQTVQALTPADLQRIRAIPGVAWAVPVRIVTPDFIQSGPDNRWEVDVQAGDAGGTPQLAGGRSPDPASGQRQVAIPLDYVGPLGFTSPAAAVGHLVSFGVTDSRGRISTVAATVVGVVKPALGGTAAAVTNTALTTALADRQQTDLPRDRTERWAQAAVRIAPDTDAAGVTALKDRLTAAGFQGRTVADDLGSFTTVINAIVLILNGFGVIALVAAGFGIVNTLLMAVQERTREIGLHKALGMSRGRVFALFSLEAGFIGLLGAVLGSAAAIAIGTLMGLYRQRVRQAGIRTATGGALRHPDAGTRSMARSCPLVVGEEA